VWGGCGTRVGGRLGKLLEGGRPISSVIAETQSHAEHRRSAKLESQVEYLQKSSRGLEAKLSLVTADNERFNLRLEQMQAKNVALVKDLADFDRLARELQQEKLAATAVGQSELRKARLALARQKEAVGEPS
jgi:predicted RNase H-like nuclease (RuvC/YqgF family)